MYRWIQSIGGVKNAWEICKLALIVGWNAVKLAFFTGVYWVIDLVDKLKLCWQKAGVAIANFMGDMKVSVLTILQNMINGAIDIINKFIGVLNKIPGVSIDAIEHGVNRVHILDGRIPHSLLLEIFTNKGIGTAILKDDGEKYYNEHE